MTGALEKLTKDNGKDWFQILIVLVASSQGFISGALSSWSSPFMVKISQDKINYNITEDEASLFAVLNNIGPIVLTPFLVPLIDKIGRKNGFLLVSIPYLISWVTKGVVTNVWGFYFARILVGVGDALVMTCTPMYLGEVTNPKVRGSWGNCYFLSVIFGSFIVNVIGIYCSVAVTSVIFAALEVLCLILTIFIPESPYYYIAKNREEDAKKTLRKLTQKENIDEEFKNLKADVKRQLAESGTWVDLVKIRVNLKALFIGLFLRLVQICSGVALFGSYTQFIFYKVGSHIDADMSTIIYSALNLITYSIAAFGSHKLGRRKSLLFSLVGTSLVFLLEFIYFFIERNFADVTLESIRWFPLVGLILFLIFSSFGVGPIPVLMLQELFAAGVKSRAMSTLVVFYGIINLSFNNVFYYLNSSFGLSGPFLMFAISNFVSLIVTYCIIPETKGKTLEQIQQMLQLGKKK